MLRNERFTRWLVPIGRVLFALIFIRSAPGHFTPELVAMAEGQGVPLAHIAVPLSGVMAGLGGLSVALGLWTRIGAWLLILFLIPVTVMMHAYWGIDDPAAARAQEIIFMKNVGLLGGALLLAHFGGGPFSVDQRTGPGRTPPL